jgi:hypothetical protein
VDKKAIVFRLIDQMSDLGLLRTWDDVLVIDVMDVECSYVIYDHDRSHARRTLMEYLNRFGIHRVGRYGNWEYSGMEEALAHGKPVIDIETRP